MSINLVKNGPLLAPVGYWMLPDCTKKALCNGCGPAGNVVLDALTAIIPDSLLGLDITEACNIHDYCCSLSGLSKKITDNIFLDNMTALIHAKGGILQGARDVIAFHYWLAVRCWRPS